MSTSTRILITGSSGLVGTLLASKLQANGYEVRQFDIRRSPAEDLRNMEALETACDEVDGVIHLAAVSRVVWAHRYPALCQDINENGTQNLADCLRRSKSRPWMIFSSSREVYGQQDVLPVEENAELRPCNVYARSKVMGEQVTLSLRDAGHVTAIVRLSNVYGEAADHQDRVVPAYARVAAKGGTLRVEGEHNVLDFTHVADVTQGLLKLVQAVSLGEQFPPIHFTTGRGVSLGELAGLAENQAIASVSRQLAEPRNYDVSRFSGAPARALELLGWAPTVSLETGFARLVRDFSQS